MQAVAAAIESEPVWQMQDVGKESDLNVGCANFKKAVLKDQAKDFFA